MSFKCFVIAEAGVNHNGDLSIARRLIDAAVTSGADVVKFQTFRADLLVTKTAKKATYQEKNLGDLGLTQYEMLKRLELPLDAFKELKEYAEKSDIEFLSTPFDFESADCIESLVRRYKISSGDCTNFPFLEYIASKGKPVILSTGMASLTEVGKAVNLLKKVPLTLLHCTTNYPCPPEEVNLRAMHTLKKAFHLPVGYSDHTMGIEISIAAVAAGAEVLEKHFTLDRNMSGPDHRASLEPDELKNMIQAIRKVEMALGDGVKKPQPSEISIAAVARKSLFFSKDLQSGKILEWSDVAIKRPGDGLAPAMLDSVIGCRLTKAVKRDDPVTLKILENGS